MKYRVKAHVEIGGVDRRPGEILDESEFRPGDPARHPDVNKDNPELGEAESLVATGHIEEVR